MILLDFHQFLLRAFARFREPIFFEGFVAPRHTPKKFLNYLLANLEYRMGRLRPISRPYQAVINPTDVCNLSCPLCPARNSAKGGRKRSMMRLEDFKKTVDELGDCLYSVFLYNWGEPFLSPKTFEMIKYAKSKGISTFISSNMSVRISGLGGKIVGSGLDYLYVSIDGNDAATYSKYRRGGDYSLVMSNLGEVLKARKALKSKTPFVVAGYLAMRHNEGGVERFKKEMLEMGVDRVYVGRALVVDYVKEKGWLPLNEEYNGYSADGKRKTPFSRCSLPWTSVVIHPNLAVSICCAGLGLFDEGYDLGSLRGRPFPEVWNSNQYSELRRIIRDKVAGTGSQCSKCIAGDHPFDIAVGWAQNR